MIQRLTNDDVLDVKEKSKELFECIETVFEDCDIRLTLASLSVTICLLLSEVDQECGNRQASDLFLLSIKNGLEGL